MRKIIFSIPITLDGFIEGQNRELDWVSADDELHDFASDLLEQADLMLYGRITYQLMADYWPTASNDPQATPAMKRFAETLNPMHKIVYSTTLKQAGWNTQVFNTFDPARIREMKTQAGKTILLSGGANLAQQFFTHGLVDEYQPILQPAAISKGTSLFMDIPAMLNLEFQWSRRFSSGAVALCYRINGKR